MSTETSLSQSVDCFTKAMHYMPGGVNSPVRAFNAVGGKPPFFTSALGAHLTDMDGKDYIDYVGSWGPMILGHCHPDVVQAVCQQAQQCISLGAPSPLEVELAAIICQLMPAVEKVRMVNSGTEATMTALRLARGVTGRNKIIKFAGCYHGHSDSLLVEAGSGALTLGHPSSPGIPASIANQTLVAQFNDMDSVTALFDQHKDDIAAIIVEPIPGNMNMIFPKDNFLSDLRNLCDQYQSLLIFDEVMSGFRVALGGAQQVYNITPDITTLGKVIGGGLPVGAIGAKKEIMDQLTPVGPIYQAGTLSGNPLAMTAGITTLKLIQTPDFFTSLAKTTSHLMHELMNIVQHCKLPFCTQSLGGMFGMYFSEQPPQSYQEAKQCNQKAFARFYHGMLNQGIYFAPSAFEAGFVSSAHQPKDIQKTLAAASNSR